MSAKGKSFKDRTGQRGQFTITREDHRNAYGPVWECICSCGVVELHGSKLFHWDLKYCKCKKCKLEDRILRSLEPRQTIPAKMRSSKVFEILERRGSRVDFRCKKCNFVYNDFPAHHVWGKRAYFGCRKCYWQGLEERKLFEKNLTEGKL